MLGVPDEYYCVCGRELVITGSDKIMRLVFLPCVCKEAHDKTIKD